MISFETYIIQKIGQLIRLQHLITVLGRKDTSFIFFERND